MFHKQAWKANALAPGTFTWVFRDFKNHGWRLVARENPIIIQAIQWRRQACVNKQHNPPTYTVGIIRFKSKMTHQQVKQLTNDNTMYWSKFTGRIQRDQNHPGLHDQRIGYLNQEGSFHATLPTCTQCGKPTPNEELLQHYGICIQCYKENISRLDDDKY